MVAIHGSSGNLTVTLTVTESSHSAPGNSSVVSWSLTAVDAFGASHSSTPGTGHVTIDGVSHAVSYEWSSPGTGTRTLGSGTQTVAHNSNGTKAAAISFTYTGIPGSSEGSTSASGSIGLTNIAPTVPTAPSVASVVSTGSNSTTNLTWARGAGSTPSGYTVEWAYDAVFTQHVGSRASATPSIQIAGCAGGQEYWFRVLGSNTSGSSPYSGSVSQLMLPPQPTAPVLTATQPSSLGVAWAPVASATSYNIDYSMDGFQTYQTVSVAGTSATLTLTPGLMYGVRVSGVNATGSSIPSTVTQATVMAGGKRWDGTAWGPTDTARRWNGSSWVPLTTAKRWNGTEWVTVS